MRIFILIALLFAFTSVSFVDLAQASMMDHAHINHQMDHDDGVGEKPCHSEHDQIHHDNGCDDCCCVHSHSMVVSATLNKILTIKKQKNIIASVDNNYSTELSGLKRPPRL